MSINTVLGWFEAAVPNPTPANQCIQLGVHYEEVGEMAEAIGDTNTAEELASISAFYKHCAADEQNANLALANIDHAALLDSLCDQIVTATGVAYMMGYDIRGALAEVDRSNWSKFVDGKPVFNAQGKIAKGPNYTPPDLTKFLNR